MINRLFGSYLVESGRLTKSQLEACFVEQSKVRVKLGLIAVSEKMMTVEQADEVNHLQTIIDKRFGDIAIEKGYLSEEQVSRLLGLQGNEYLSFAQTVTDKGFMTIADIENALSDYQKAYGFTATDIDALKSGDSDRIVPLYIPSECDPFQLEHIQVALRLIVRLINNSVYIGRASIVSELECENFAYQSLEGDSDVTIGFSGPNTSLLSIASPYAGEEFDNTDLDALDAVAEFTNNVNGLFATGLGNRLSLDMVPPKYSNKKTVLKAGKICKIPVFIDNEEICMFSTWGEIITE